jgi:uncharacterized protein
MKITEDDILLRISISEKTKLHGKPLYEAIVQKAMELNLAGATVSRGVMGFGSDKKLHTSKIVELSENLPVIVEIVENEENINKLLPYLDENVQDGFVTLEKVHVLKYRKN